MENKRQQERYKLTLVDTHTKLVLANDVRILDMSLGGLSLKADRRMNIGCSYMITIKDEGRVLNIKGTVKWSLLSGYKGNTRGENVPIYTAGMNFTDISIEKQKEIEDFIERHRGTTFIEKSQEEIAKSFDSYTFLNPATIVRNILGNLQDNNEAHDSRRKWTINNPIR